MAPATTHNLTDRSDILTHPLQELGYLKGRYGGADLP